MFPSNQRSSIESHPGVFHELEMVVGLCEHVHDLNRVVKVALLACRQPPICRLVVAVLLLALVGQRVRLARRRLPNELTPPDLHVSPHVKVNQGHLVLAFNGVLRRQLEQKARVRQVGREEGKRQLLTWYHLDELSKLAVLGCQEGLVTVG
eukprot:Lithocolla_globosa_v1_NODE_1852_length_2296_cov_4.472557.p3 type:complete len:151 gc:universal NODE_1852_length_2296_cov_4.472557:1161-709(-)